MTDAERHAAEWEALVQDGLRYRALHALVEQSVSVELRCHTWRLDYQNHPPADESPIELQWYPDTPVGYRELGGVSLRDILDQLRAQ